MVHAHNPSTLEGEAGGWEHKTSLGYCFITFFKEK